MKTTCIVHLRLPIGMLNIVTLSAVKYDMPPPNGQPQPYKLQPPGKKANLDTGTHPFFLECGSGQYSSELSNTSPECTLALLTERAHRAAPLYSRRLLALGLHL